MMRIRHWIVFYLCLVPVTLLRADPATRQAGRDVTFISTSDCHYVDPDRKNNRNESNHISIEQMNAISEANWPKDLGGERVARPRGVVVLGDCIDEGDRAIDGRNVSKQQYDAFVADFGLDGTDGRLKFPAFEGWGNHDGPPIGFQKNGFSFQAQLKLRNQARLKKNLISNISDNGLHYSWDWDDVHFVQLNLYPADQQRAGVKYSPTWHDPQGSLSFLKKDLAEKVGDSHRPVVLMSHCGFDTNWWTPDDWAELYQAVREYNVVLYLYGHSGTGVRTWAPSGETRKLQCINDGQTEKGFFVIHIGPDRLRAAMRIKSGYKVANHPDGSVESSFDGQWTWKYVLDCKLRSDR